MRFNNSSTEVCGATYVWLRPDKSKASVRASWMVFIRIDYIIRIDCTHPFQNSGQFTNHGALALAVEKSRCTDNRNIKQPAGKPAGDLRWVRTVG